MTSDEYVPSEEQVRAWCREGVGDYPDVMDEWITRFLARVKRDAVAEHRIARLEAQTDIRGRAVVMYRERAREAETRIEAVRDVHTGTVWPGVGDKPICDACDQMWPCDTIRALDGTDTPPDAG